MLHMLRSKPSNPSEGSFKPKTDFLVIICMPFKHIKKPNHIYLTNISYSYFLTNGNMAT